MSSARTQTTATTPRSRGGQRRAGRPVPHNAPAHFGPAALPAAPAAVRSELPHAAALRPVNQYAAPGRPTTARTREPGQQDLCLSGERRPITQAIPEAFLSTRGLPGGTAASIRWSGVTGCAPGPTTPLPIVALISVERSRWAGEIGPGRSVTPKRAWNRGLRPVRGVQAARTCNETEPRSCPGVVRWTVALSAAARRQSGGRPARPTLPPAPRSHNPVDRVVNDRSSEADPGLLRVGAGVEDHFLEPSHLVGVLLGVPDADVGYRPVG